MLWNRDESLMVFAVVRATTDGTQGAVGHPDHARRGILLCFQMLDDVRVVHIDGLCHFFLLMRLLGVWAAHTVKEIPAPRNANVASQIRRP